MQAISTFQDHLSMMFTFHIFNLFIFLEKEKLQPLESHNSEGYETSLCILNINPEEAVGSSGRQQWWAAVVNSTGRQQRCHTCDSLAGLPHPYTPQSQPLILRANAWGQWGPLDRLVSRDYCHCSFSKETLKLCMNTLVFKKETIGSVK